MKKIIITLFLLNLLPILSYSQITGSLIGYAYFPSPNVWKYVNINPNTGFVSAVGTNTTVKFFGAASNSALNCTNNEYVIAGTTQKTSVIDKSTGSLINTFGYDLFNIAFNQNDNFYYGIERKYGTADSFNLVKFNPITGYKNNITNIPFRSKFNFNIGSLYTIDLQNNSYVLINLSHDNIEKVTSINCNTGIVNTVNLNVPVGTSKTSFSNLVYNNQDGKFYGVIKGTTTTQEIKFTTLSSSTGSVTIVSSIPTSIASNICTTGNNITCGVSINPSSNVYSFIAIAYGGIRKIINLSLSDGQIVSSPSLSNNDFIGMIQYSNCQTIGITEIENKKEILIISPNPSSQENITILNEYDLKGAIIKIYNTVGDLIVSEPLEGNEFNISKIAKGLYIVEVNSNNIQKSLIQKLIIE